MTAQGLRARLFQKGWLRFGPDRAVLDWLEGVRAAALKTFEDPELARAWTRAGGTWFVGVNALPNDGAGRVAGSAALSGPVMDFLRHGLGFAEIALDRAQVSALRPGFPLPDPGESAASAAFRRRRDGAHVDGLHALGADRRRYLREYQGFLLGLPLSDCAPGASPLVVWEGSHRIIGAMFREILGPLPSENWPEIDLTEAYTAARGRIFDECPRVELPARPGEALLLHRFALHGIAPWQDGAEAPPEGRVNLYFRPEIPARDWLERP